jgi:hypothetical protein
MTLTSDAETQPLATQQLRHAIYAILVVTSLASMFGRILNVRSADRQTPFLSANDRSRWCTIRALVDLGTYHIDQVQAIKGWNTIDKVYHTGRDGQKHYFSSKPPLLPTMIAWEYWLLKRVTGANFAERPFVVGRTLLVVTNLLPLGLYFWLMVRLIERQGTTDWGRIFAVAVSTWGTYLTTFAVTLNNHLPAAICTAVVLYCLIAIWYDQRRHPGWFLLAGLAAAFAAANELPALSLYCLLFAGLLWKAPAPTLLYFLPASFVVVAGFFLTNYEAHQSLVPAYGHRQEGENWYDYPGSYWKVENRRGVDLGEPSRWRYAMHVLIGHHGVLSLTPVWILSILGVADLATRKDEAARPAVAIFVATLTFACTLFYLLRPEIDRNYGGVASGFRWLFWLTPLWLFCLLPIVDSMARSRWLRWLAIGLLAVSVLSTSYPSMNPWQHPWIYQFMEYAGW